MVISAVTGALVMFDAIKEGIVVVPVAGKPMDVLLLVQLKVVPVTGPEIGVADTAAPLQ